MNSPSMTMPYGAGSVVAHAEGARLLGTLDVAEAPPIPDPARAFVEAETSPIGLDAPLFSGVNSGDRVLLVVSDSFRDTAIHQVLPAMLERLTSRGIPHENVAVLVSTGTHRGPTQDELRRILGDDAFNVLHRRVHIHDAFDADAHVHAGVTKRGTPVFVNRLLLDYDRVFVTGTVVLHYFAGFGGGPKAIVPGLTSVDTISHNHALNLHPAKDMLDPAVRIAARTGNPVAEDLAEAAAFVRVDGLINTVLNGDGGIAGLFAGEMAAAHDEACAFAKRLYAVPLETQADLVIAASPHTKNFLQTHKALYNAYQAMAPGGRIILLAPCEEGLGSDNFVKWLRAGSVENIFAGLRRESEINGQTALSTRGKAPDTTLVTELSASDVALLGTSTAPTLQAAVDAALELLRGRDKTSPAVLLMPNAAYSVPLVARPAKSL